MGVTKRKDHKNRKNYLFQIAIDEYTNKIPPLNNCVKDASELKDVLINDYQFQEDDSIILTNQEASRERILLELKKLRNEVNIDDNLLITFSGHGIDDDGIGYWLPADADSDEDSKYISISELIDRLNLIKCHHLFIIVDACFSGKIFTNTRSNFERGDEKRPSRYGLSASHSKEVAFDGSPGENSPFAKYLLQTLKRNKKPLPVNDLASKVITKVQEDTNDSQTPIFRPLRLNGDDLGQFILYPKHLYFKFEDILSYAKEGKYDNAVIDLRNFCLEGKKLPLGYESLLVSIQNKIIRANIEEKIYAYSQDDLKELNATINFELHELVKQLYNYKPKSHKDFSVIFNLLGQNNIENALELLKKKYEKDVEASTRILLLACRINIIKKTIKIGVISYYEFKTQYSLSIKLILLLIDNLINNKTLIKNDFFLAIEFHKKRHIEETIILLDNFLLIERGEVEEFFLLQMLKKRYKEYRFKFMLETENSEEIRIEFNKIAHGLEYLINKIENQKIDTFYSLNKKRSLNYSFLDIEKKLWEGDIKLALKNIIAKFPDETSLFFLNNLFFEYYDKQIKAILPFRILLGGYLKITKKIMHFINIQSGKKEIDVKNDNKMSINEDIKLLSKTELYNFIAKNEIIKVFQLLLKIKLNKEQEQNLKILELKYSMFEEDKIFTQKDYKLLNTRQNKIYAELDEFIKNINKII